MGHLHRWAPVLVYSGEDDAAVIDQRIDVKDFAGNETSQ